MVNKFHNQMSGTHFILFECLFDFLVFSLEQSSEFYNFGCSAFFFLSRSSSNVSSDVFGIKAKVTAAVYLV